ncbi:MAG: Rpn family recombination-promoting nuclease/putative transposase [Candidatus Competibacteraceae bacterium]
MEAQQLTPNGKLPPVLPLVLYNGRPLWTAATELADLIETPPGNLIHCRPRLRYLLLEANRYRDADLAPLHNLSAALFQLENSRGPPTCNAWWRHWSNGCKRRNRAVCARAFAVWLRRVLPTG